MALLAAVLQPGDERFGDGLVGAYREQQRHVDVDPLGDQRADGGDTGVGAGDLDHQVRAADPLPEAAGFDDGVFGAEREVGRDLDADIAADLLGRVINRAHDVAGRLDVLDGERFVDVERILIAMGGELLEAVVVIGAVAHGLLEDGRVGGDALQAVTIDQFLELRADEAALDEVEPGALAESFEALERVTGGNLAGAVDDVHTLPPLASLRAVSSTASGVNPNFFWSAASGAEAPNVFMAMIAPWGPT